jgi:transcription termination factor Rho
VSVLQRKELEQSPLADLHAIASELSIEGYRGLRRDDLVAAILGAQGGEAQEPAEAPPAAAEQDAGLKDLTDGEDVAVLDAARAGDAGRDDEDLAASDDAAAKEAQGREEGPEREEAQEREEEPEPEKAQEREEEPERELVAGVLDVLPNGSGFLRVEGGSDVYVSPAQIRRCELRAGDEVSGPLRPQRRNERHASLVRVEIVNGKDAEPPEERPRFEDLTPVYPTERLPAPPSLASIPLGKGSRVAIAGGPGAGATRLLREIVATLRDSAPDLPLSVVLVGARPEEVTDWTREGGAPVAGGSFDRSTEAQVQAAELTVERAKRVVERGGDAVVVIDSLEALPGGAARRLFGAARNAEDGGSLTVLAATGMAWEPHRQASTWIALDSPLDGGEPRVSDSRSGTLRADLLS